MVRVRRCAAIALSLIVATPIAVQAERVNIGFVNVMDDAPVILASEAGYYEESGLDARLVQFQSGTDLIKGIVTRRLDVGVLGFTNAITWASRGADLRVVGGAQRGYHALLARVDSGIEGIDDLAGRSLATQKQGSTADIVLTNVILRPAGLQRNDVSLRYVSPAVAIQSVVAGAVDAAFVFEPYSSIARHTSEVVEIAEVGETWPFPCMVVVTSGRTWAERRDAIVDVLEAQRRAIDLLEQDPWRAASTIWSRFIPSGSVATPAGSVPAEQIVAEAIQANSFTWRLSDDDVARMGEIMDMMREQGLLAREVDLDTLLDLSWQDGGG